MGIVANGEVAGATTFDQIFGQGVELDRDLALFGAIDLQIDLQVGGLLFAGSDLHGVIGQGGPFEVHAVGEQLEPFLVAEGEEGVGILLGVDILFVGRQEDP